MRKLRLVAAAIVLVFCIFPAAGQEVMPLHEKNIFFFTGRMLDADIGESLNVLGADYEGNYITGLGYQSFFRRNQHSTIGYEFGAGKRYGDASTFEVWGGLVVRMNDIKLGKDFFFSPSIVFGLSGVNAIHAGREQRQENYYDGDAKLVFYFSPEIDFKVTPKSRYSFFWRLHHRSGAWETLGAMKGASNANVFGIRVRF